LDICFAKNLQNQNKLVAEETKILPKLIPSFSDFCKKITVFSDFCKKSVFKVPLGEVGISRVPSRERQLQLQPDPAVVSVQPVLCADWVCNLQFAVVNKFLVEMWSGSFPVVILLSTVFVIGSCPEDLEQEDFKIEFAVWCVQISQKNLKIKSKINLQSSICCCEEKSHRVKESIQVQESEVEIWIWSPPAGVNLSSFPYLTSAVSISTTHTQTRTSASEGTVSFPQTSASTKHRFSICQC
jgi:hypothetical protein